MLLKAILVSLLFIFAACTEPTQEDYNESLTFERLSNGDLLYVMEFKNSFNETTTCDPSNCCSSRSGANGWLVNLFPLNLLYLVDFYKVNAFEFSLTHGAWQGYHWGLPSAVPDAVKPSGAHLFSIFEKSSSLST